MARIHLERDILTEVSWGDDAVSVRALPHSVALIVLSVARGLRAVDLALVEGLTAVVTVTGPGAGATATLLITTVAATSVRHGKKHTNENRK